MVLKYQIPKQNIKYLPNSEYQIQIIDLFEYQIVVQIHQNMPKMPKKFSKYQIP